ncbi:MAG TPA: dihydroneopterin aldolase [Candidatus Cloacimonadota bacterium]|nr:dihydroneopterin aldolase [Candidatus Cloacimonadota bacterium]HQH50566.1 dihydroneopterin aldolase [Candidatus Cloacimonadota bacterium]
MIIRLNEMVFYGFHGLHDEERKLGQRFIVTAQLFTDPQIDDRIRCLDDTIDYTKVYQEIKTVMETNQFLLLEDCANTLATKLLADFPLIQQVRLCIQKPSVPIPGSLRSVEVELFRTRS